METYLKDAKPIHSGTVKDIETVTQYLEKNNGDFSKYSTVDSRITTIENNKVLG